MIKTKEKASPVHLVFGALQRKEAKMPNAESILIIYEEECSREEIIATIRAFGLSWSLGTHIVGLFLMACRVP